MMGRNIRATMAFGSLVVIATAAMMCLVCCERAVAAATGVAATPMSESQRLDVIKAAAAREVSVVGGIANAPTPIAVTRDLTDAAFGALLLGQDPKHAAGLIDSAFSEQIMDPKSVDYGEVPWQLGRNTIHDPNAIEYCMQPVGPILAGYSDKLGSDEAAGIKKHIVAGIAAMRARHLTVVYTNVWLMRCECYVLCGQAVGDDATAKQGYSDLAAWLAYTAKAGIHEFDSPTYYAVDLNSLLLGYRYASDPTGRGEFKSALDLFWTDICANYFPAREDLSGPHSRDDDQLYGAGDIDNYLFLAGLRDGVDQLHESPQMCLMLAGFSDGGYAPSQELVELGAAPYKLVQQSWSEDPALNRSNYITPTYSIGSSDGDYGSSSKPIDIEFASQHGIPVISVVPDDHDQPYGKLLVKDAAGFTAPGHLLLHPACVQSKSTVLALLDIIAPKTDVSTLATNVIMPADIDDIRMDGKHANTSEQFVIDGRVDSVVVLREGKSAVAIRVIHADGYGKVPPSIALKGDPVGLKYGAVRLAIYHYAGSDRVLAHKRFRVGLLIIAGSCDSAADEVALAHKAQSAQVRDLLTAHDWSVSATVNGETQGEDIDLTGADQPVRTIDGAPVPRHILTVNGTDYAAQILGTANQ